MTIVGAFIGQMGGTIPAGYGVINLQWDTVDRLNIAGASFTITGGGQTYTVAADATGRAEKTVPVGSYTVNVTHTGTYSNDGPRSVNVESMMSYLVYIEGRLITSGTTFTGPLTPATYTIKKGTVTKYTGSYMASPYTVNLDPGSDYSITLSLYGDTATKNFTVYETQTNVDLSDLYCHLTISNPTDISCTLKYNNNSISSDTYVIRTTASRAITGTVSTRYGGASTSPIASVPSQNVTPNAATKAYMLTLTGTVVTITEASTLTVPLTGKYHVLVIGGGSGGGTSGLGGSGGHVDDANRTISSGDFEITIGAGGASDQAGGATSFGTIASASGGSVSIWGEGPNGGAGGGGRAGSSGTNGSYGGGGEGHGSASSTGGTGMAGGTGGTYGGKGGKGGGVGDKSYGGTGGSGTTTSNTSFYGSGSSTGGTGGNGSSANYGGGGGGGGGRNAKGGNGGNGNYGGGGGGGGGIGGGNGGNGGNGGYSGGSGGTGGLGYGAGGGCKYDGGYGGGGGGGGLGSSKLSSDGTTSKSGSGAPGAVRIQWVSAS